MLRVVTAATAEPVTLAEARMHLREDNNARDSLILSCITASREIVERQTGHALVEAEYLWIAYPSTVGKRTQIPFGPISNISAVTYADADGVRQTVASADYVADLDRSTISLDPSDDWTALNVQFTTVPAHIPSALKAAILLLVGDLIANTEAGTEKALNENPAVQNLMFPYRRVLP